MIRRPWAFALALLAAGCAEPPTTTTPASSRTPAQMAEGAGACSTVFGPWRMDRASADTVVVANPGTYYLMVEDDGDPGTSAAVLFNQVQLFEPHALLGPVTSLRFPVSLTSRNSLRVRVRPEGHHVTVWIQCGQSLLIQPAAATVMPNAEQQFTVQGAEGPYRWAVHGTDGGNETFGTVDSNGLYRAPDAVPAPPSFPLCVRLASDPATSACATLTIVPSPTPHLVVAAGEGQSAPPGGTVIIPPAVLLTRADGSPWPGVAVTFEVTAGGGTVSGATAATGEDGIAAVGSWTLGPLYGTNTLTATADAPDITGNPVTFTAAGLILQQRSLAVGNYHACGLDSAGLVYCWGRNTTYQVSALPEAFPYVTSPVPISRQQVQPFVSVVAGSEVSCALTEGGDAYCWGLLGHTVYDGAYLISGGHHFSSLAAGEDYACGLEADGTAWCWGANGSGRLGDGTTTSRTDPVAVVGGLSFAQISASWDHTCGVTHEGSAYCWGYGHFGALGDGTLDTHYVPTRVVGDIMFSSVHAGQNHTCGLANDGTAWCWGWNNYSQLGDNTTIDRVVPTPVAGGLRFTRLEAGRFFNCGVDATNRAWCWGWNWAGQLGNGRMGGMDSVPGPVQGGIAWASVLGGQAETCGIDQAGTPYCWGSNYRGVLGDGTEINRDVPTLVQGNLHFVGKQ